MTDAFETELLAAVPDLRRSARAWTRDREAAEDLVQDTLVRALHHKANFLLGSNMGAWLTVIARNRYLSRKRRSWRTVEMFEGQAESIPAAPNQIDHLMLQDTLRLIDGLGPVHADIVLSIALDGTSQDLLAEKFDVPVGTIKSRLSRARAQLREGLGG